MNNCIKIITISLILVCVNTSLKAPEVCEAQKLPSFFPKTLGSLSEQSISEKDRKEKFLIQTLIERNPAVGNSFLFRNHAWTIYSIEHQKEEKKNTLFLAPTTEFQKPLKIIYSPEEFTVTEIESLPSISQTWKQTYFPWLRAAALAIGLVSLIKLYYSFQESPQ